MQTRMKLLPALCCIAFLGGCASNQPEKDALWSITPATKVSETGLTPAALYQTGRYFQGQNRLDLALNAYQKALVADEHYVEARNGVGVIHSRQGRYAEAIAAFDAAIALAPDAAHLHSNLGYAYYLQGRYADAVLALQKSTSLDPSNKRALNNLGLAHAKLGNQPQSMYAFNEATKTDPETMAVSEPETSAVKLDKPRGVLRPALVAESSLKLAEVSPKVFELQYAAETLATRSDSPVEVRPDPSNIRLEVANGNGRNGLAKKVGQYLNGKGYSTPRLTNQKPYQIAKTQIHYRAGHLVEAELIRSSLQDAPELIMRDDLRADVQVRLVLGKDILRQVSGPDDKWLNLKVAVLGHSA